jgi:hypothetical protein
LSINKLIVRGGGEENRRGVLSDIGAIALKFHLLSIGFIRVRSYGECNPDVTSAKAATQVCRSDDQLHIQQQGQYADGLAHAGCKFPWRGVAWLSNKNASKTTTEAVPNR